MKDNLEYGSPWNAGSWYKEGVDSAINRIFTLYSSRNREILAATEVITVEEGFKAQFAM